MDKKALIDAILEKEWPMFHNVNGEERASCQNDYPVFEIMRRAFEAEEWFLNRLVVVETPLLPDELMRQLLAIESALGRVRHQNAQGYTSRSVDLDILYYGEQIVSTDWVIAPHPRLHLRRFALLPLCELIPDFMHPVLGLTQTELLERCNDPLIVRKMDNKKLNAL